MTSTALDTDSCDPSVLLAATAQRLILQEAELLDTQQWDAWLNLYDDDAIFWLPAWIDEHRLTSNVNTEISHIYHSGVDELRERVVRISANKSQTALPLPRTAHVIGAALIANWSEHEVTAKSNATVHIYDMRSTRHHVLACRYEHILDRQEDVWRIKGKKIVLVNDLMPSVIDFYSV